MSMTRLLPLSLSIALSIFSYCSNANLPEAVNVRVTNEVVESSSSILTQGVSVDANIPKILQNPQLDELDLKYSKCGGLQDIREVTIAQLQTLYKSGKLSAVELTKCYIERVNKMNPVLHAIIELNPDALKDALALDQELESGNSRGPLHGIPVLLKDGIGTNDLTESTVGSPALVGIRPKNDAEVVAALRKAGAIILGKSNPSEFYWLRGTNIPNGWSGRGGQTRNAYNLNESPEGSSSGSSVSVTSNLCVMAVGTESEGSLTGPATLAGICSMKPTLGLVSVKGVIPASINQDYVGPMARTTTDLSILLDGMVPSSSRPPQHPSSYSALLTNNNATRPFRIGVVRHPFWNTSVLISTHLQYQVPRLEKFLQNMNDSASFEVLDYLEITEKDLFSKVSIAKEMIMFQHEFKHGLNEYLKNEVLYPTPNSSVLPNKRAVTLKDIIQFNKEHTNPEGYNQDGLLNSEATDGILNETYINARDSNRAAAKQLLDSILDKHNLDAIVTPSDPTVEGKADKDFEDFPAFGFSMACISGYPSVQIPAGIGPKGVPFGIMFVGKPYAEPILLQIANKAEQLSPQRSLPKFLI